MAQTIKLKRSALQGAIPSTSSLELGEVALNTYDGKMYIKKDDGTPAVVEIGGGLSNLIEDTTPQLGGDLYNNGNNIIVSNGNINLQDPTGGGTSPGTFYGATALFGNDTGVAGYVQIGGNTSDNGTLAVNGTVVFNANTIINSIVYPDTDGTNGQVLTTDGSGNLSFTTPSSGISNLVEDTTPQLGGELDNNGNDIRITNGNLLMQAGANSGSIYGSLVYLGNLLGTAGTLIIEGDGVGTAGRLTATGDITLNNLVYPSADGTNGQVLITDGAGNLSFADAAGGGLANIVEDTTPQLGGNLDVNDKLIYNDTGTVKLQAGTADYVTIVNSAGADRIRFSDTGGISALGWYHSFGDSSATRGYVNIMGSDQGFDPGSGTLRILNGTSSAGVALTVPTTLSGNYVLTLPGADGTNGQVLTTDGSGNLSFTTPSGGISNLVEDTTPQLGGDLLTNGNNIHVEGAGAAQAEIKLYEAPDNGSNYVALRSNSLLFNSYTLTLPVSAGANGQVLTTDGSGVLYFTTPSGGVALTDLSVTQNTASGNGTLAYNNTSGVFTYTPPDLSSYLTSETTTTLTGDSVNQRLVFTNETGTPANIDLSWAVDDTNLARITSGSVNGSTGIATFTRDDASTFTVDFSALFDDTNLTRITSGSLSGTTLTLTRSDATTVTTDISSLDSRYLATSVANQEVNTNSNVTFGNVNINGNLNAVDDIYLANRIMHEGDTDTFMQFHAADQWRVFTGGIERFEVNNTNVTVQNDLIVNGGDITLGGTGRIQGIDTVSANTDAANKLYVDNAVAGAGGGTFETLTCSTNYGPNIVDSNNTYSFVNGTYGPGNNFFVGQNAGITTNGNYGFGSDNNFIGASTGRCNTTGNKNNFFGAYAGFLNTTGSSNNFFGRLTGFNNSTGNNNNFFGNNTGYYNSTGSDNNFIGRYAGFQNTTGSCNNFIGLFAGRCNTTGSSNTYLGGFNGNGFATSSNHVFISDGAGNRRIEFNNSGAAGFAGANFGTAGQVLTSCGNAAAPVWADAAGGGGTFETLTCSTNYGPNIVDSNNTYSFVNGTYGPGNNFFVGQNAGITTNGNYGFGSNNNFIGESAGRLNTTGSANNFFGPNAGRCNTTGGRNNFFGSGAGLNNTTGNNNNFFGNSTGFANTTGYDNNFFGAYTGFYNTTGFCNNFIGSSAGRFNTTGSCNTYLGGFDGTGFATCSNHVFISDGAGNRRIEFNNSGAAGFAGANFGTAGQVLTSCGNASAPVWADAGGGGISNLVEDTTPQLGGNLDLNNNYIGDSTAYIKAYDFGTGSIFGVYMQGELSPALEIYANPGSSIANVSIKSDLSVDGGDITLGGTGRIQGIDTVSANTDAANKLYVDNAVAGAGGGGGTFETLTCSVNYGYNVVDSNNTYSFVNGTYGPGGNFFVGQNAGVNTNGAYSAGSNNNFIGRQAGQCNTTGANNNFFGAYAGTLNTTGENNNFIGRTAGYCNTTGSSNNFIGYLAGNRNTTGSCNNFFGNCAGYCNTTGSTNNFFGISAGLSNTTGNNNNFFGPSAGIVSTTGSDNNFFGNSAGRCNTTGSCNIFIGTQAGYFNTTGYRNTFIGTAAGFSNTTGFQNSFFGNNAGQSNTTGSRNIYLGGFTGSGFATCSNYVHFSDGAGNHRGMFDSTGDFHSDGDVIAYSTSVSDERLKKDISIVTGALSKIRQINGVEFTMKDDESRRAGVIAQDVEKVFPVAVTEKKLMNNETYKTVRYDALHALLIEAVKELADAVEKLSENK